MTQGNTPPDPSAPALSEEKPGRAWYGRKVFYFVEMPRRFMVCLWGIPVFWQILPERWMALTVAAGCIAYDLLVTSRAPDLRLTREEVQARLAEGGRLYYLTVGELTRRIGVLALLFCLMLPFDWYWYTHNQEPTFLTRLATAAIVLIAVAYVSKLGIPLRTAKDIPSGAKPFTFDLWPKLSKDIGVYLFGLPGWMWAGILILSIVMWGMAPSKTTGGLGFTGEFPGFVWMLFIGYTSFLGNLLIMPMVILRHKIQPSQRSMEHSL